MANEKISDLPNLTNVASGDEIAIVDVSAGATKKATIANAVGDYGNTVYPRLSADNTFTAISTWSSSASTSQIRFENTGYGGNPGSMGQTSNGSVRVNAGDGTTYECTVSGSEGNDTILRRTYADDLYAQLDADNTFTGVNLFTSDNSANMIRIKNTDYTGDYSRIGMRSDGRLRLTSGAGWVHDIVDEGSEDAFTLIRRKYGDTRYTQISSDESKKENIQDLQGSGDIIDGLMPRNFTWIPNEDDPKPEGVMTGLIAQEVEQVLPGAVLGSDGNKGIDALSLIGVVVAELKALRARVAELEGEQ